MNDLAELRYFVNQLETGQNTVKIVGEDWDAARKALCDKYHGSALLENCCRLLDSFAALHPEQRYLTDFKMFTRESKLEDFVTCSGDVVLVGTIHKSKGKEFDAVHLLLEGNVPYQTQEDLRQLYVALTRAKSRLVIHHNGNPLAGIRASGVEIVTDSREHPLPEELVIPCGLRDIYLDYSAEDYRQKRIEDLRSGDPLLYSKGECQNLQRQTILRFSQAFMAEIQKADAAGYKPYAARVGFVVHWRSKDAEKECLLVLPELHFGLKGR